MHVLALNSKDQQAMAYWWFARSARHRFKVLDKVDACKHAAAISARVRQPPNASAWAPTV